jgi:hypothetical protein
MYLGELNVVFEHNNFTENTITNSINTIITKLTQNHTNNNKRTLFDSTKLTIQNTALAQILLTHTKTHQMNNLIQLVN